MKKILLLTLLILTFSAYGGRINEFECSGVPRWVSFKLRLNYELGTFHGHGIENYFNFDLDCKKSSNERQIVCESNTTPFDSGEKVSVVINIDKDYIVTAAFRGIYSDHHDIKIGCIAGM